MRCRRCGHTESPDNHVDTLTVQVNVTNYLAVPLCQPCRSELLDSVTAFVGLSDRHRVDSAA